MERTVVVGAAIVEVSEGVRRVLAAERAAPPPLRGRWEFPGGKVEPGEAEAAALVRECREELAVEVTVGARIGADLPIGDSALLRVYAAALGDGARPQPLEHGELRWLAADELAAVPWLPTNLPLLPAVAALLTGRADGGCAPSEGAWTTG